MRITFDYQIFTFQQYGGISRYYYELIDGIRKGGEHEAAVALTISNNAYLNPHTYPGIYSLLPEKEFKGKHRLIEWVNRNKSLRAARNGKYDIFHPTYYDPYFIETIGNRPYVTTFLDMIHEKFSHEFADLKQDSQVVAKKREILEKARGVIAISQQTKNDIVDLFKVNPDKIKVIYLGSSLNANATTDFQGFDFPYLLHVGNRNGYKNFSNLLKSVKSVFSKYSDIKLVCAGGGNFNKEELEVFAGMGVQDRIVYTSIDNAKLAKLYRNALAFIFPSLYEGFGIPVVEAFSCGAPCILSTGGSLPEVGEDAAVYFNPRDPESIAAAIENVLSDESLRKSLIKKGYEQEKKFTWAKTVEETLAYYKEII
ncbi:glycosyltransferase family 4 protein [Chitinophaga flava]|uniref:Glycosyltransferase family 1 protein n=1 Tax=Chitinophaga flava TaxID=2259036 RepID=A0A365Y673_9BACT|nr:glycosyltransferase family 1 protein [Chitinophaga flava]RBL93801.1 glycosyltransferase family 1 protein [Chitinophaga flava]